MAKNGRFPVKTGGSKSLEQFEEFFRRMNENLLKKKKEVLDGNYAAKRFISSFCQVVFPNKFSCVIKHIDAYKQFLNKATKQSNVYHWTYSDRGTRKPKHISNFVSILIIFGVDGVGKYTNYLFLS